MSSALVLPSLPQLSQLTLLTSSQSSVLWRPNVQLNLPFVTAPYAPAASTSRASVRRERSHRSRRTLRQQQQRHAKFSSDDNDGSNSSSPSQRRRQSDIASSRRSSTTHYPVATQSSLLWSDPTPAQYSEPSRPAMMALSSIMSMPIFSVGKQVDTPPMQLIDVPMIREHWQRCHYNNSQHTQTSLQQQSMPIRHVILRSTPSLIDTDDVNDTHSQYRERLKRIDIIDNTQVTDEADVASDTQERKENEHPNAKNISTEVVQEKTDSSADPTSVESAVIETDDDLLLWKARIANLEATHQQRLQLKRQIRQRQAQLQQQQSAKTSPREEALSAAVVDEPQRRNICIQSDERVENDNGQGPKQRDDVAVQTDVDPTPPSFSHPIKPKVAVRHPPMKSRTQFQTALQVSDESAQSQLSRLEVERQRGFELEARANTLAQIGVIGTRTSALAIIEPALLLNAEQIRQKYEARVAAEAEQKRTLMALINGIQTRDAYQPTSRRGDTVNNTSSQPPSDTTHSSDRKQQLVASSDDRPQIASITSESSRQPIEVMAALDSMTADIVDIEQTAMQIQSELDNARSTSRVHAAPSVFASTTLNDAARIVADEDDSRRASQVADAEDIRRRMNGIVHHNDVKLGPTRRTSVQTSHFPPSLKQRHSVTSQQTMRNPTTMNDDFDDANASPLPSDSDLLFVSNVHSALTPVPLPPSPMRQAAAALNTRNVFDPRLKLPSATMSGVNDVARKVDAERIMSAFRSEFRAAKQTQIA